MTLLDLYHRLPYGGRCLAASLRGLYLRGWRYGADTPRLVEQALEREHWSARDWQRFREQALAALLHRAATRVPYYRRLWRGRPRQEWQALENWPILRKEAVQNDTKAFLADDRDPRRMFVEHTSGSTGTPLTLWWSRATTVRWFALFEARLRLWHGVDRHRRWAIFGGQLVAPVEQRRPPLWVWNAALGQLYLSSYHLEPANVEAYLEAMARYRVQYLLGYPSAMAALARMAEEQGLETPPLTVAISNAEPLFAHQRQVIESAFGCPVRDTYGAAEIVCAASECPSGRLHLWPEVGWPEVLAPDSDSALPPGDSGRLVATGLLNVDMPLIRYQTGDRAALAPAGTGCDCGRGLPILAAVEGRLDDAIVTADGRQVGRLDPVFKADFPIREAQIEQVDLTRVILRVVPARGFGPEVAAQLEKALRQRLGPTMEIDVEEVPRLPRNAAGKFRAVISRLSRESPNAG